MVTVCHLVAANIDAMKHCCVHVQTELLASQRGVCQSRVSKQLFKIYCQVCSYELLMRQLQCCLSLPKKYLVCYYQAPV